MEILSRTSIAKTLSGSNMLDVGGDTQVDGQLVVIGNLFANGNTTLGNATSDTITFTARAASSLVPSSDNAVDLGQTSGTLFWRNLYIASNVFIKDAGSIESINSILNLGTSSLSATVNLGVGTHSNTINIGTGSGTSVINIGSSGDTINIGGNLTYINTTNTNVLDKIVTFNYGGAAASGFDSGIEIDENSIITGYFRTSSDRLSWTMKSPARGGSLTLTPDNAFDMQVATATLSANRTWTIPDSSDTFTGNDTAATLNNKTINGSTITGTTTVSGDMTFTGAMEGRGIVPVGAIMPVMMSTVGAYSVSTGLTSPDAYGWVRCEGQTIADVSSPMFGHAVPNLSDGRFIRGSTSSSNSLLGSDTVTLSGSNLPSHSHTMNHDHGGAFNTLSAGIHNHTITVGPQRVNQDSSFTPQNIPIIDAGGHFLSMHNNSGPHDGLTFTWDTNNRTGDENDKMMTQSHYHAASASTDPGHVHSVTVPAFSGSTGSVGSGSAFSILPKYVTAVYIIRVK